MESQGYARILPFDGSKGAAFYIAKYITKQGSLESAKTWGVWKRGPILPLQGAKTGGYHVLPVVRESRKHPRDCRNGSSCRMHLPGPPLGYGRVPGGGDSFSERPF